MTDTLLAALIMAPFMGVPMLLVLAWDRWRKRRRHRRGLAAEVERSAR